MSVIYISPSKSIVSFIEDLDNYFSQNTNFNIQIIIGDTSEYLALMDTHCFEMTIDSPIRVTQTSKSCIVHLFIRKKKT